MDAYADSSFLVSLYTPDTNSAQAAGLFGRAGSPILLTPFGEFECVNAIELRAFRKEITTSQAAADVRALEADIAAGLLVRRAMPPNVYERAMILSGSYTRHLGTRGMDILHVAIALELRASVFFTFDQTQRKLARAAGLMVRPGR